MTLRTPTTATATVAHLLVLALACVVVYWNTLHNGFHLDDPYRVVNNPGVQQFWPPWRHFIDPSTSASIPGLVQYRPMLPLSLSISYAISGGSEVSYHVGNLLLQILASVSVYLFVRELLGHWTDRQYPQVAPLLVALVFAVHPISGIPVNYICSRDLLLMQMFLMASLYCYARMRRLGETGGRWTLCLILLLLAVLSKKNAALAPLLVLLFEIFPAKQSLTSGSVWRRLLPFATTVGVVVLFIRYGLGFSDFQNVLDAGKDSAQYLAGQVQHHVFHYLSNFFWPLPIRQGAADPVVAWKQVVGAVVIVGSWVLAWRWRRRQPLLSFSLLGYQALLLLTSSVLPLHAEIVSYRVYPSSAFLFLGLGILAFRNARVGTAIFGAAVVYFGVASVILNRTWQNGETLYRHSVEYGAAEMALTSLAEALPDGAEKESLFRRALELNPNNAMADIGLAQLEIRSGRRDAGLQRMRVSVQRLPKSGRIRNAYAQCLDMAGLRREAAAEARRAMELDPNNVDYRLQAAVFAIKDAKHDAALRILEPLLRERPWYKATRYFAAVALCNTNRPAEATALFEQHLQQYPEDTQAWYLMGVARMMAQQFKAAIPALERCLQLDSTRRDAHLRLAECHEQTGNRAAANQHRRMAGGR